MKFTQDDNTQGRRKFGLTDFYHLQDTATMPILAFGYFFGDLNKPLIIEGFEVTKVDLNNGTFHFSWTAGKILYKSEIYEIDAFGGVTETTSGVLNLRTFKSYNANDPTLFETGAVTNIHEIRKATPRPLIGGQTLIEEIVLSIELIDELNNYLKWRFDKYKSVTLVALTNGQISTFFDFNGKGLKGEYKGYQYCNGLNSSPNMLGRVPVQYNSADPDFNTLLGLTGTKTVLLTANQSGLPSHSHSIKYVKFANNNNHTDDRIGASDDEENDGSRAFTNSETSGGSSAAEVHNNIQPSITMLYVIRSDDYFA